MFDFLTACVGLPGNKPGSNRKGLLWQNVAALIETLAILRKVSFKYRLKAQ
jgi:hypothetical protein